MNDNVRAHLIHAFRKVLRPLVKILVRAGVRYDEFIEVIKGVYVESAIRDGVGHDGPLTRARVAIMTGVPRRDVDRYIDDETLLAAPPPTRASIITEVLHLWNTDPQYLGPYGLPMEIDFEATPGRCFRDLVRRADGQVDPGAVLEDLVSSGVVIASGDYLKVLTRSYVITNVLSPQGLEYFGKTMATLANTLERNLSPNAEGKLLQRTVVPDKGLPAGALPEFEVYLKQRVQQLLVDLDDWIGQSTKQGVHDDSINVDTGVTVFHYINDAEDDRKILSTTKG